MACAAVSSGQEGSGGGVAVGGGIAAGGESGGVCGWAAQGGTRTTTVLGAVNVAEAAAANSTVPGVAAARLYNYVAGCRERRRRRRRAAARRGVASGRRGEGSPPPPSCPATVSSPSLSPTRANRCGGAAGVSGGGAEVVQLRPPLPPFPSPVCHRTKLLLPSATTGRWLSPPVLLPAFSLSACARRAPRSIAAVSCSSSRRTAATAFLPLSAAEERRGKKRGEIGREEEEEEGLE